MPALLPIGKSEIPYRDLRMRRRLQPRLSAYTVGPAWAHDRGTGADSKKPRSARPRRAVTCPKDQIAFAVSADADVTWPGRNVNSRPK